MGRSATTNRRRGERTLIGLNREPEDLAALAVDDAERVDAIGAPERTTRPIYRVPAKTILNVHLASTTRLPECNAAVHA